MRNKNLFFPEKAWAFTSPHFARPEACSHFTLFLVTVMASTEIFSPLWVVAFNLHISVSKADNLLFTTFTGFHHKLLATFGLPARLVALHPLFMCSRQ